MMQFDSLKKYANKLSVLYVEDDTMIASMLMSVLEEFFEKVLYVEDGKKGLDAFANESFDIVLSDISMPNMNGIEMARHMKIAKPKQKIIFSTAHSDSQLLLEAIKLNIDGYMLKPIDHRYFFELLEKVAQEVYNQKELEYYKKHLEDLVEQKTSELEISNQRLIGLNQDIHRTLESTILSLGGVAEARSNETGKHVKRVALYSEFISQELGLSQDEINTIRIISPIHDIGKLAIEDGILKKPGKLTYDEYEKMKTHAYLGYEMLKDSPLPLFQQAAIVAYEHHEKYDGSGYPRGLKAEQIHIYGRITAFADVFDALGSKRVYKQAWDFGAITELIQSEVGKHFDPQICELFFKHKDFFFDTLERLQDD